jgi:aspartate carbamoyltransferase catalytic subunit
MDKLFHVVEAQQFDRDLLSEIFAVTKEMEEVVSRYGSSILNHRIMASLFYEPSTRTRLSFESAMFRLGGDVITTESAREFSSAAKGETLEDTIRIIEGYSDVVVMRHYESGAARRAANVASVPIINAGDGPGQHPTQALLDLYTIQKEIGRLDRFKIAMVGDLANGRTTRSLAYLLSKYKDVQVYFVAPRVVKMKDDIKAHLDEHDVKWEEADDLIAVAREVDVVYQTRIQKERFGDRPEDYEQARGKYIIDDSVMAALPEKSVVLHPLPRVDEIAPEVDSDPRAAYFRQAHNGLYIRMALLQMVLER